MYGQAVINSPNPVLFNCIRDNAVLHYLFILKEYIKFDFVLLKSKNGFPFSRLLFKQFINGSAVLI